MLALQEPTQSPWVIIFGLNEVCAESSVGLDWDYLSGEPDLLSLCSTHQTSTVEPSETASKGLFFASTTPADFMHLCSYHIKHHLAPTVLQSTVDS